MGRSKKKTTTTTTVAAQQTSVAQSAVAQLGDSESIIRLLKSASHTERIDACNTLAALVNPSYYSGMVACGCVELLVNLIADKVPTVAVAAAGAVRNICVEVGVTAAQSLANTGLTKHLLSILDFAEFAFNNVDEAGRVNKDCGMHWYYASVSDLNRLLSQIFSIFSSLCEASEKAVADFTAEQVKTNGKHLAFIMNHTIVTPNMSLDKMQLVVDALHFLRAATIANNDLNQAILSQTTVMHHILTLAETASSPSAQNLTIYTDIHGMMRSSLIKELRRKQGALSACFVVEIPRVATEIASLAAATAINLLQTAVSAGASVEAVQQLSVPALKTLHAVLTHTDISTEMGRTLAALEHVRSLMEGAQSGALQAEVEAEKIKHQHQHGVEQEQEVEVQLEGQEDDGELPEFLRDQNSSKNDLPVDTLWTDAANTHLAVYNQHVSALKNAFDALASFLALLPAEAEDDEQPSAQQLALAPLAAQFLLQDKVLEVVCKHSAARFIPQLDVIDNKLVASTTKGYSAADAAPSTFPEDLQQAMSRLPMAAAVSLSHNINMLRVQAVTALSAACLFLPSDAFTADIARPLYNGLAGLLAAADVEHYRTSAPVTAQQQLTAASSLTLNSDGDQVVAIVTQLSACAIEEAVALASAFSYLVRRPQFRAAHDQAWASIDAPNAHTLTPEQLPNCLAPTQGIVNFLTAVAKAPLPPSGSAGTSVGETKLHVAGAIGALGVSPLAANVNGLLGSALLDMIVAQAAVRDRAFDYDLMYEVSNAVIDIYCEDDRNIEAYKTIGATQKLAAFAPFYLNQARELAQQVKNKKRVSRAAPDAALVELEVRSEKAMEAAENVKAFVQYKKKMGI